MSTHTGHCTRKIKLQKVLPDPRGERGRRAEVFKSWRYSSIPCLPSATGVTLALIKTRPDLEHKAAARGILALPAQLCFTLLLEEADGSEVHVIPPSSKPPKIHRALLRLLRAALVPGDTAARSRALWSPGSPLFPTAPPGRLVQCPLPSIPSYKPTFGFFVFYSQSVTPGLAGSPWGPSPVLPLTQGHSHPIDHHERSLSLPTVDLRAPGRSANQRHGKTHPSGQGRAPRQQSPAAGSEGTVPPHSSPDTSLHPAK